MKEKQNGDLMSDAGKRRVFWRSSLYDEPIWVSLAWVLGPALVAGIAIILRSAEHWTRGVGAKGWSSAAPLSALNPRQSAD